MRYNILSTEVHNSLSNKIINLDKNKPNLLLEQGNINSNVCV